MTLHILFSSSQDIARQCATALDAGDALLLVADGVYAAVGTDTVLDALAPGIAVHALQDDCRARGIDMRLHPRAAPVDYAGFVALAATHARSVSWF